MWTGWGCAAAPATLGVTHQTVANGSPPTPPRCPMRRPPHPTTRSTRCRLWNSTNSTLLRGKKQRVYLITQVDRATRCFTRSLHALGDAVTLFVYAWNRRQRFRHTHPKYPTHVFQFVYPPS
jgi:hypothetical protein